jgi:SAM-dependent methyltransferase
MVKTIESPHNSLNYTLFECQICNSRFFDNKEYDFNIDEIYEKYPENKEYMDSKITYSRYWDNQKNILIKVLGRKPKSVLDLGCRTGDFLTHFDNNIVRDGVELAKPYASIGRERGLNIYDCKLEDVNFDKKYDIVSAYAILEHLLDPLDFLNNLDGLVAEDGLLVILIPSHENLKRYLIDNFSDLRWHMYSPPEHLNFFSKQFLDTYLEKKGFSLVKNFWTSGGTFNPFRKVPVLGFLFKGFMFLYDSSIFNKIPIFDHLYLVYRLNKTTKSQKQ